MNGANLSLPVPASATQYFNQAANVIVQLHARNGACWETTFTSNVQNEENQYKAKF